MVYNATKMSCGRLWRVSDAWRARFDAAHKGLNAIFVQPLSITSHVQSMERPILSFMRTICSFNVTWDAIEKEWKAAHHQQIYLDGRYYEACFMTRLAAGMMELGYKIERRGKFWDVAGLDKSLLDKFSQRTKEIEAEALKRGITDPDRKGELGAKTRKSKKPNLDMDALRDIWMERLSTQERRTISGVLDDTRKFPGKIPVTMEEKIHQSLVYSIGKSFEKSSVVDARKIAEEAMRYAPGYVMPEDTEAYRGMAGVMTVQESNRNLVTTEAVLAQEKAMLAMARAGRGRACRWGDARIGPHG